MPLFLSSIRTSQYVQSWLPPFFASLKYLEKVPWASELIPTSDNPVHWHFNLLCSVTLAYDIPNGGLTRDAVLF